MKIQSCASGYQSNAATVYCLMDPDTDKLVVSKIAKNLRRDRFSDSTIVTNTKIITVWEAFFTDENLPEAIEAFMRLSGEGRIVYRDGTQAANPAHVLQVQKVVEKGRHYEISPEISNAQFATLMAAWHAQNSGRIVEAFAFGDELDRLRDGHMLTI